MSASISLKAEFVKGLWRENPIMASLLCLCPALAVTNAAINGLAMGLARRVGRSLRITRNSIEVTVILVAFSLGGSIGLGTLVFALLMGPTMQASLKLFNVSHDPSPSLTTA